MKFARLSLLGLASLALAGCGAAEADTTTTRPATRPAEAAAGIERWSEEKADRVAREKLDDLGYRVTREDGTERAFTSELLDEKRDGVFACVVCELPLYPSEAKYDSGTGWPSFWKPVKTAHVATKPDRSLGMVRTEVECARCGSHLGHVFDDGPEPTGKRHCINGVTLAFEPDQNGND